MDIEKLVEDGARAWASECIRADLRLAGIPMIERDVDLNVEMQWREFEFPARAVIRLTLEAAANDLAGLTNAEILLAAGEMTAGELRSVRAVLNWQSGHLRTLAASIGGNT